MDNDPKRFECLIEPSGTWMVRDNLEGRTATLDGKLLRGRKKQRAEAACGILTRIFQEKCKARLRGHWPKSLD